MAKWSGWTIRADPKNEYILIHDKEKRKVLEYQVIQFANDFLNANVYEIKGAIKAIKKAPKCGVIKVFREPAVWYNWQELKTKEEIHEEFMREYSPGMQIAAPDKWRHFWRNVKTGEEIDKKEMARRLESGEIKSSQLGTISDCYKNLK